MPMLMKLARVSTRRDEVWRHCEICDELAAMAPHATTCDACSAVDTLSYGPKLAGRGWS